MNITNLALKEDYEPVPARKAEIRMVCRTEQTFDYDTPVLLPKEEHCCDMATD